jgi:FOG: CheY-like receiver
MPVLDGYKTAQKLREIEGSERHTFVMALTAHAMPGEREKCLAAGMDDYLSKPVDLDALAAALKKYEARNVQCENKYGVKSINSENKSQLATNYTEVVEKAQVVAVRHQGRAHFKLGNIETATDCSTRADWSNWHEFILNCPSDFCKLLWQARKLMWLLPKEP